MNEGASLSPWNILFRHMSVWNKVHLLGHKILVVDLLTLGSFQNLFFFFLLLITDSVMAYSGNGVKW